MKPRSLRIISELYYPEETSTGYFLTGIAEGLAECGDFKVSVLCAQPSYSQKGLLAPQQEILKGVSIRRLAAPLGDKNRMLGRLWNTLSLSFRFGLTMFGFIRRGDVVMVVTNPPSLPLLVAWIAKIKGAIPVLLVHDVYPDVLVPTGITKSGSVLYRIVDVLQSHMLRQMRRIVVLGRDMQTRLQAKLDNVTEDIFVLIPNWGDAVSITPNLRSNNRVRSEQGLESKFIIQFSGNLGRTHGLEDLVSLAGHFKEQKEVHFLVFGWGAGRAWLDETIITQGLTNITLLPPCEKHELGEYLTACDIFFMPFKKGMEGISVPSRLYNVMAAGNPVLAVADSSSELALVVKEEGMGWVVAPGNLDAMCAAVENALTDRATLLEMSAHARHALETKYTQDKVVEAYVEMFDRLLKSK